MNLDTHASNSITLRRKCSRKPSKYGCSCGIWFLVDTAQSSAKEGPGKVFFFSAVNKVGMVHCARGDALITVSVAVFLIKEIKARPQ